MAKGRQGESCRDAIKVAILPGEVVVYKELFRRVKEMGSWSDETIWQHLMSLVVNLPPARHHWKKSDPFLFLHGDGRYQLYDERIHPRVRDDQ